MATPSSNEQFVGIAPQVDLTERGSNLTNDKRQIYTYAELLAGARGATNLEESTTTPGLFAGVSKMTPMTVGTFEYDVYNLKAIAQLRPQASSFVLQIGDIEVSLGQNIFFIANRTNIEAVDFAGTGGYANNPINFGAMVDDNTDVARPIDTLCYVNQDNNYGLPPENNGMFIVAEDSNPFECDVYVDMDFIIPVGSSVEFTIS